MNPKAQKTIDALPKLLQHALDHHQIMYEGMCKQRQGVHDLGNELLRLMKKIESPTRVELERILLALKDDWEQENEFILDGGDYLRKLIAMTTDLKSQIK